MSRIIPLLRDLVFERSDFELQRFTETFYTIHRAPSLNGARPDGESERAWIVAQDHWEQVVERFLDTRELRRLSGRVAMAEAVRTAAAVLTSPELTGICPICTAAGPDA